MRPHITTLLAAVLLTTALAPSQAGAQSGNGLYEPFPEAAVKKRAQRYVDGLRSRTAEPSRRYSDAELAAGAFVRADPGGPSLTGPARGSAPGLATGRAGRGGSDLAPPLQVLLLALGIPAAVALTRGRSSAA